MPHNNDEKVSLKELWDRFYQLRDVEIQNLWQRTSIFAGFIGLLFAGYGYIFLGSSTSDLTVKHAWSCGIAILAIIFSIFWIALAKGAKAWIGVHERKICEIEAEEELGIPARFCMGELSYPGGKKEPNNNLLSMRPGTFSVSKLNILLGQVLLICWSLIGLVHAMLFVGQVVGQEFSRPNFPSWVFWILLILVSIVIVILISIVILIWVFFGAIERAKSESLLSTKEEYKKERINLLINELKSLIDEDKVNLLLEKIDKDPTLSFVLDKDTPDEARKRIEKEREIRTELEKEKKK